MIQYSLKCENDHSFDSWFASADAYDKLADNGMVSCAVCGSTKVSKAIMAPRVRTTKEKRRRPPQHCPPKNPQQNRPWRKCGHRWNKIQNTSDEFRHRGTFDAFGDAPERDIYGDAKPEESKSLIDDGIPVTPLPFMPARKSN